MSEKHLTEPPWKALALKYKVKDTGLQKALLGYAKIEPAKNPAEALEALEEIALQATKLKKANQAVADVADYLDEVLKEAAKNKRTLAASPKPEEPKTAPPGQLKEEAESEGLKDRLINALKKVKAAEGKESIRFVACIAKPYYGVLLAKSASDHIGPAHKKELTELTQGTRFVEGSCLFEKEAYTFVVETVPPGLAKNLKKALKEHTGLTYKVRVRDLDGKVVTDGDTEVDPDETTPPPAAPAAVPGASAEAMSKFTARFKALQPDILNAIKTKSPQGDLIRQRATEAGATANKKDFEQANRLLDQVEALLAPAGGEPEEVAPELIPQLDARLLADAQQAFAEYLEMKPAFTAVGIVEAQLEHVQALHQKWLAQVGDRGAKENKEKMDLLNAKVAMELEAYKTLKDHTGAMDELMDRIDKTTEAAQKAQLIAELQEMMAAFPA